MASCFSIFRNRSRNNSESHTIPYLCACDAGSAPPAYSKEDDSKPLSKEAIKAASAMKEIANTIEETIKSINEDLRKLSLNMWNHPEIAWKEHHTHDLFVDYLQKNKDWKVTPHAYNLETAFNAEFIHNPDNLNKSSLPCIGFQSELDALPGIGHACGHNLIAISGIAASFGLAAAFKKHNIAGKIILIGTPAEEAAGGKLALIKANAYKGMDACLMVHPAPISSIGKMLAVQQIYVTFEGRSAHAGAAPWEGINAQDAGVLSYMNISALRQQIPPSQRVHGIIQGQDWAANVIPSKCKLYYNTRALTSKECEALTARVNNCFEAAGKATGCKYRIEVLSTYDDVANNANLAELFQAFSKERFDRTIGNEIFTASTDFGNVTHLLPSLHAEYSIPLKNPLEDKNHTIGFAKAAKTPEAHQLTLDAALTIAISAAKICADESFRKETWKQFKEWKRSQGEM